jgi:hypothetical protein
MRGNGLPFAFRSARRSADRTAVFRPGAAPRPDWSGCMPAAGCLVVSGPPFTALRPLWRLSMATPQRGGVSGKGALPQKKRCRTGGVTGVLTRRR